MRIFKDTRVIEIILCDN